MKRFKLRTCHGGFAKTIEFVVDDDDAHLVRGYIWDLSTLLKDHHYIRRRTAGGDHVYLHKQILGTEKRVYHKNGNSLDNRRSNLTLKDPGAGSHMRDLYRLFEAEPTWR